MITAFCSHKKVYANMDNKKIFVVSVIVIIATIILFVGEVVAIDYCDGDDLYENITVDGTTINLLSESCEYGCENVTWTTLGNPGCVENPIMTVIIGIIIVVLFIILMRFLL